VTRSPLLDWPDAVEADGVDAGVAAHYGALVAEQRALTALEGFVDLSHRAVLCIDGPDRLSWLHSLTTQQLLDLPPHRWTTALVLSPQGHVEHAFEGYDDGAAFWLHTEPDRGEALAAFLDGMRFMLRVEVHDVTASYAAVWRATGTELVARDGLEQWARRAGRPAGTWAYEALRIARGEPRFGLDTDHRTIPNEVGWIESAVHLDKGCYRGQETVARVHTLGRPPRRLTLLHLDGSVDVLPAHGAEVVHGGRAVGFVGSAARHHELGPIALALLKRNVPTDAALVVTDPQLAEGIAAAQETLVDPEVGLHVRPRLA
jgi:tRNA-modifying protein YgfZ